MDILTTMKFIRGAVSTKNLVPEMKHFWINEGSIRGYNGVIALQSPIDFAVPCMPLAVPLVTAISKCEAVMSLGMTASGRLRVQSGKFLSYIECLEVPMPDIEPVGDIIELDGKALIAAIRAVKPFIGSDASRPWVNGVLLRGQSAFATNNVCLVEYWIGVPLPLTANLPIEAVNELLRITDTPTRAQVCDHSITFHYPDGRWLKTQLYSTDWPDLTQVLERPSAPRPMPPDLFEGLETIRPFLEKDGNVYFRSGGIHTSEADGVGASYQVEGLDFEGIYKLEMLKLMAEAATMADMVQYPGPCPFWNDRLRGVIIGLRP